MEISVLRHSHYSWWDKVNTLYMEFVVYSSLKISFEYFAYQNIWKTSKSWFKILVSLMKFSPFEYQFNLKWYDMDKLFDNFPHRNIISRTYSKLNTIKELMVIHSINVIKYNFTLHLMPHLSRHLCKQTLFLSFLRMRIYKGKKSCRNSKNAY